MSRTNMYYLVVYNYIYTYFYGIPFMRMYLLDPGGNSPEFGLNLGIADDQQTKLSMCGALKLLIFQLIFKNQNGHPRWKA